MKINTELISIIIPVYNTANYLNNCIESVLSQTYSNIEVILIDDGSTDSSSQICDNYKKMDNRIIVIHQDNQGVAICRNVGISKVRGAFVSFVDSDDFVSPVYIEQLYNTLVNSGKKIAVCSYCHSSKDLSQKLSQKHTIYSAHDAIEEMILERAFPPSPWGKLYSTELFKNIRYPNVVIGEDYCTAPMLCKGSDGLAYVDNPLYLYNVNEESITKSKFNSKHLQYFDAAKIVREFLILNYQDLVDISLCRDVNVAMAYYIKMCRDDYNNERHKNQIIEIINQNYRLYLKSSYPLKKRIAALCFALFPNVCGKFFSMR